jgi:hypothetical protein
MSFRVILAALITASLLTPVLASAQSAAVDTQLQLEAKRKRLVVRPEPPVAAAVRDADRAASESAAGEMVREANDPVYRHPQLDYDVTSAVQARTIPRAVQQRGPNR